MEACSFARMKLIVTVAATVMMTYAVARRAEKRAAERRNTLQLFAKHDQDPEWYHVVIQNVPRFELPMDMVAIGMSFR